MRFPTIAINESYRLAPWADVLYAADGLWWASKGGLPEFRGLRISAEPSAASVCSDIKVVSLRRDRARIPVNRFCFDPDGAVGGGGNSGFQALNLALQFGARRLIGVGFDMSADDGLHWHGAHPPGRENPTPAHLRKWAEVLDAQEPILAAAGIELVIASEKSALSAYPKMAIGEALARWGIS